MNCGGKLSLLGDRHDMGPGMGHTIDHTSIKLAILHVH